MSDWETESDMQLCRVCREEKFLSEFQADGKSAAFNTAEGKHAARTVPAESEGRR